MRAKHNSCRVRPSPSHHPHPRLRHFDPHRVLMRKAINLMEAQRQSSPDGVFMYK